MSNNFRWFKHYNDASEDLFIRSLEAEFGPLGYSVYFKSLEVLSKQGVGDNLLITTRVFAQKVGAKQKSVRNILGFCQKKGKMLFVENENVLNITFKKFSELQDRRQKNQGRKPLEVLRLKEEEGETENNGGTESRLRAKEQRTESKPRPKPGGFLDELRALAAKLSFKSSDAVRPVVGGARE